MSTNSKIHQIRLSEWAARIADQQSSGLSVPQWCEKNGITTHKYFYWKRLLKSQVLLTQVVQLARVAQVQGFLLNGISIELDSSASEDFIRTLIKAVRYA